MNYVTATLFPFIFILFSNMLFFFLSLFLFQWTPNTEHGNCIYKYGYLDAVDGCENATLKTKRITLK